MKLLETREFGVFFRGKWNRELKKYNITQVKNTNLSAFYDVRCSNFNFEIYTQFKRTGKFFLICYFQQYDFSFTSTET